MHDNCLPESSAVAADSLRLAVSALAEFPSRAGAENVAGRISVVAALCDEVDRVMDSLVVRTAAEAAEEGWTSGRMRETAPSYHARLQRALNSEQGWSAR
ncbi:hypothetical protein [Kitasatospora viridis]|uniref:Uncharacterized protein n=1 Tax=Kitasatospora viridis TaxID=281105 RepID=A0A561SF39_9ACTN|nr:hypothetical protein [Kitasatospora viridis]TWF73494.1 hypothetical protein FHX73_15106 [Kitasatospora viridis]